MKNNTLQQALSALLADGVVVLPSDTVIGLVARAQSPKAVMRMYEVKQRSGKPGTIIAASIDQLAEMGFNLDELERAQQFWPGPVSVVLAAPAGTDYLHMGLHSLAVRIPDLPWLKDLLAGTGPLATTSANMPSQPVATSILEAETLFGDSVDFYLAGRIDPQAKPSQVVRFSPDGTIEYLRK